MRFFWSTFLLMCLWDFNVHHVDWLTYSGGNDTYNSVITFLSQVTILRWFTFLLRSQTAILAVLFFWIYLFLLLLFVLQLLPSIGKLWSCCCLSFHWLSIKFITGCLVLLHSLWLFLFWLEWSVFVTNWEIFHGRIS